MHLQRIPIIKLSTFASQNTEIGWGTEIVCFNISNFKTSIHTLKQSVYKGNMYKIIWHLSPSCIDEGASSDLPSTEFARQQAMKQMAGVFFLLFLPNCYDSENGHVCANPTCWRRPASPCTGICESKVLKAGTLATHVQIVLYVT